MQGDLSFRDTGGGLSLKAVMERPIVAQEKQEKKKICIDQIHFIGILRALPIYPP